MDDDPDWEMMGFCPQGKDPGFGEFVGKVMHQSNVAYSWAMSQGDSFVRAGQVAAHWHDEDWDVVSFPGGFASGWATSLVRAPCRVWPTRHDAFPDFGGARGGPMAPALARWHGFHRVFSFWPSTVARHRRAHQHQLEESRHARLCGPDLFLTCSGSTQWEQPATCRRGLFKYRLCRWRSPKPTACTEPTPLAPAEVAGGTTTQCRGYTIQSLGASSRVGLCHHFGTSSHLGFQENSGQPSARKQNQV
ncbi:unnamed protein product [Symbiodinium sp. CCMP2456]|nr:unnamed protein product [Symbiodinium sp. CCMP2456]